MWWRSCTWHPPLPKVRGFLLRHTMTCVLNFGGFLLLTTLHHGSLHRLYGRVPPWFKTNYSWFLLTCQQFIMLPKSLDRALTHWLRRLHRHYFDSHSLRIQNFLAFGDCPWTYVHKLDSICWYFEVERQSNAHHSTTTYSLTVVWTRIKLGLKSPDSSPASASRFCHVARRYL